MKSTLIGLCVAIGLAACSGSAVTTRKRGNLREGTPYSLPRTVLDLDVVIGEAKKVGEQPFAFSAGLTLTPRAVADPRYEYVLEASYSGFAEDDVTIQTNSAGLLTSVSATSTDKTIDALKSLNQIAVNAAKISAAGPGAALYSDATEKDIRDDVTEEIVSSITLAWDVLKGSHKGYWALPDTPPWAGGSGSNRRELAPGLAMVFEVDPVTTAAPPVVTVDDSALDGGASGIAVRGVRPYIVKSTLEWTHTARVHTAAVDSLAKFHREKQGRAEAMMHKIAASLGMRYQGVRGDALEFTWQGPLAYVQSLVHAPDYSPVSMVPFDRALFVKTVSSTTFTDGVLTDRRVHRGSTVAAAVEWPLDLSEKLVSLPKEILQLKFNLATEAAKTLSAEEKLRDAEAQAKLKALERVEAAAAGPRAKQDALTDAVRDAEVAYSAFTEAKKQGDRAAAATSWAEFVKNARRANELSQGLGQGIAYPRQEIPEKMPFE